MFVVFDRESAMKANINVYEMHDTARKLEDSGLVGAKDEGALKEYHLYASVRNAFLANFFLNGLIAWLCFGTSGMIPVLGGMQSFAGDLSLTSFLLTFIIFLVVSIQLRARTVSKTEPASERAGFQYWFSCNHSLLSRGLLFGSMGVLLVSISAFVLLQFGVDGLDTKIYLLGKAIYTGVLAGTVTLVACGWKNKPIRTNDLHS